MYSSKLIFKGEDMRTLMIILFMGFLTVTSAQVVKIDNKAPDFTLYDYEGKKHTLSQYEGKYVVLEWVNFSCPFVKKHYSSGNMQSLQSNYTDKNVVWLSICSSAEGKGGYYQNKELSEMLKNKNVASSAYLIDAEGKVGKMYNAKTTPHMYVINPKRDLIYMGAIDDIRSTKIEDVKKANNYVSSALDNSMAGKPVEIKSTSSYGCSVKYK